jgi:nitric oxide reductase NorE protein
MNSTTLINDEQLVTSLKMSIENANSDSKKLPGDIAMWFFILAELTVFAIFFIGFAIAENMNLVMFAEGKAQLHKQAGLINTIALITSSYFVAASLHSMRMDKQKQAVFRLLIAMLFAVVYLVVKLWEYQVLFDKGIDIETNTFFTLYFLITAFHFMHILLGMVILILMAINANKGKYSQASSDEGISDQDISGFESGACYWHMVDLLWIILFPLIYII